MNDFIPYEELTAEQRAMVDSENAIDRFYAAKRSWGLDVLKDDNEPEVRFVATCRSICLHLLTRLKSICLP